MTRLGKRLARIAGSLLVTSLYHSTAQSSILVEVLFCMQVSSWMCREPHSQASPFLSSSVCVHNIIQGLLVAYWLSIGLWIERSRVPVPLAAEIYFSSGCTQPYILSRRFSFASFGGDVKLSIPGNPFKLA